MPKKDFTAKKTATPKTELDPLRAAVTGANDTPNTRDTKDAPDIIGVRDEFRFSARFTPTQWKFLQEKKWQLSTQQHQMKSITAILQDYVEEDMKKHPEIMKTFDELNG